MQESRLKMCGQKDKLCSSQMSCGPSPFQFFLTEIYMAQEAGTWSQQEFAELHDDKSWLQLCHEPGMSQTLAEEMNKFLGKTHELQGETFSPPLAHLVWPGFSKSILWVALTGLSLGSASDCEFWWDFRTISV